MRVSAEVRDQGFAGVVAVAKCERFRHQARLLSKGKHSESQIIATLKQVEAGRKVEDVARETVQKTIALRVILG
jgi:hypothetical protein